MSIMNCWLIFVEKSADEMVRNGSSHGRDCRLLASSVLPRCPGRCSWHAVWENRSWHRF